MKTDLSELSDAELNERMAVAYGGDLLLNYCTDANAVLPLLMTVRWNGDGFPAGGLVYPQGEVQVRIVTETIDYKGTATTFARAAVLALLRAKEES
jgi:hypothetical protein